MSWFVSRRFMTEKHISELHSFVNVMLNCNLRFSEYWTCFIFGLSHSNAWVRFQFFTFFFSVNDFWKNKNDQKRVYHFIDSSAASKVRIIRLIWQKLRHRPDLEIECSYRSRSHRLRSTYHVLETNGRFESSRSDYVMQELGCSTNERFVFLVHQLFSAQF